MLAALVIATTVATTLSHRRRARAAGLNPAPLRGDVLRLIVIAGGTIIAVSVFNSDRGVPWPCASSSGSS